MPGPDIMLKCFFDDINIIVSNDIVAGGKQIAANLETFIADAPVCANLKNVVGLSGYSSCERCTVQGSYHNNTAVF